MTKEIENQLMEYVDMIRKYKKGFEFTIPYYKMTDAQLNAIKWVTKKAEELKLIRSISIGLSFEDVCGESGRFCSEETWKRI